MVQIRSLLRILRISIGIKPYDEWPNGKTKQDLIHELEEEYKTLPGFRVGFSQPMIDGVMDKNSRCA